MDEMHPFERQVAAEVAREMRPRRPVDAVAVIAAAEATQSPKWRFPSMFSATKFVVASAIVALFGGFLLAGVLTTQPSDETVPAAVSPTATTDPLSTYITEEVEPGVFRVVSDGVRTLDREAQLDGDVYDWDSSVAVGPDGAVWLFGPDGSVRLGDERSWPTPASFGVQTDVAVGPNDTMLAAANGPLRMFDGDVWTEAEDLGSDRDSSARIGASAVEIAADGTPWVLLGTRSGFVVSRLGEDGWTDVSETGDSDDLFFYPHVSNGHYFTLDADGLPWVARGPNLLHWDGETWATIDPVGAAPYDRSGPLDVGAGGTLWSYFINSGEDDEQEPYLARLDDGEWSAFSGADGVPAYRDLDGGVEGFFEVAPDGAIWLTHEACGGVARFDGEGWVRYLTDRCIVGLDIAPDGAIWLLGRGEARNDRRLVSVYVITPEAVAATE